MKTITNKDKFGEVFTPPKLAQEMRDLLFHDETREKINNMQLCKIFEPGSGQGIFFDIFQNQNNSFPTNFHYTMNEINPQHLECLQQVSKKYNNSHVEIIIDDLFNIQFENNKESYDLVLGNLPFTTNSKKFVPGISNKTISGQPKHKTKMNTSLINDIPSKSITLWTLMTHYCFQHIIKPGGLFFCIIPCIWLKPDKSGIYDLFTKQNTILYLKIYDCASANKIFKYNCQTPICYVLIQKKLPIITHIFNDSTCCNFKLYNNINHEFIDFQLNYNKCIPTNHVNHFIQHNQYFNYLYQKNNHKISTMHNHIIKISSLKPCIMDNKIRDVSSGKLIDEKCNENEYKIITGANFANNKLELNGFVCGVPGLYCKNKKVILPHKRLPKFYKDYNGTYGLMGRDMYVFLCDNDAMVDKLYDFFNLPNIQEMICSGFRVRMNFIEKYVFEYIPYIFDDSFCIEDYKQFMGL